MTLHLPKKASIAYYVSCIKALVKKNTKYKILNTKYSPAFTLIELLVVIGILTVLLAIVLIAVNPAKQFAQANNTQRRSDVNAILNAVHQYAADNKGNIPAGIGASATPICEDGTITCTGGVDLCTTLVSKYLADLPKDPKTGEVDPDTNGPCTAGTDSYDTKYTVLKSATNNRITVAAPDAEDEGGITPTISVTR